MAGDACGQRHRLVEDLTGRAHLESEAELDQLGRRDPVGGEEDACGALPAHGGGEEHAARRLGRDAELGKGHPKAGPRVDQDQVAVGQHGEAQPDRHAVDRGEERDRDAADAVEQAHEALAGTRDRVAGGDGRHFAQVLPRGERRSPTGQDDRTDRLVGVGGAQRLRDLDVHRRVERIAHLGPVERDQPHTGRHVLRLDTSMSHLLRSPHVLLLSDIPVRRPSPCTLQRVPAASMARTHTPYSRTYSTLPDTPQRRTGGLPMPAYPRAELEEMVERWLEVNRQSEAERDWHRQADMYTEDATYGWNVGPNDEFMVVGREEIREIALGLEMAGLEGWVYPYQRVLIDEQQGEVIGLWKQVANATKADGTNYEIAGLGGSWFRYGGNFQWSWQRDFFDVGNAGAVFMAMVKDGTSAARDATATREGDVRRASARPLPARWCTRRPLGGAARGLIDPGRRPPDLPPRRQPPDVSRPRRLRRSCPRGRLCDDAGLRLHDAFARHTAFDRPDMVFVDAQAMSNS